MEMGKQNSRTFFIFQGLNFFPILYKTQKNANFSAGNDEVKRHTRFILIPVIKTRTTTQIE